MLAERALNVVCRNELKSLTGHTYYARDAFRVCILWKADDADAAAENRRLPPQTR